MFGFAKNESSAVRELTVSELDAVTGAKITYEQTPSGQWMAIGHDKNGNVTMAVAIDRSLF